MTRTDWASDWALGSSIIKANGSNDDDSRAKKGNTHLLND